jgi:phosphatidylglycerol:prolipoprotein diacylglycerol transferase
MLALVYGAARFGLEFLREPDVGVTGLFGLTMGQTLCVPMVLGGLYLIITSKGRRQRVEAIGGTASVA